MTNELLLITSLLLSYSITLGAYRFFGKSGIYCWISICTILANIEVAVVVNAFGLEQTLGNTLFASSFLATDILSECFGKKESKKGVLIGISTSIIFILFTLIWINYIPSQNDVCHPFLKSLFTNTPRILISSLIAYIVSEFADVQLYHLIWNITKNKSGDEKKFLWLRNNLATLIAQFINIVIFNFGAFYKIYHFQTLLTITSSCYIIYIATSLLDTPFIYIARKIKKD